MTETYTIEVVCTNCDLSDEIEIEKGKEIEDKECPTCGTKNLRKPRKSAFVV